MTDTHADLGQAGVADLHTVLTALADPVRLEMARRLYNADDLLACVQLYDTITKATASHHFRILREAGLIERIPSGQAVHFALRRPDVEAAYPGLLGAVLAAANAR
ncbi:ArsR/SmtB family transcription factor [Gordonia zhaorongruii]|uniref:ArsR/SmtB family transcription factor n=1 Tax=Gordonia zhaorongruii TaxID=2597659 RepID=UPI001047C0A7|nr:helix-turn-helix domain-containing protein [Gordonia zhaorongruii]